VKQNIIKRDEAYAAAVELCREKGYSISALSSASFVSGGGPDGYVSAFFVHEPPNVPLSKQNYICDEPECLYKPSIAVRRVGEKLIAEPTEYAGHYLR
jgi:hypothetical protein